MSQNPFHIRMNTTGSQLTSHKPYPLAPPNQPACEAHTHPGAGHSSLPMPSSLFSCQLFQARVTRSDGCAHQLLIFSLFRYEKTGFLGIPLLSSLQNLSGSQSIIIGTVPHSVIIQWKVPSINTEEVRDGVTTTQ